MKNIIMVSAVILAAPVAVAMDSGPKWVEEGDAGGLPRGSQVTRGEGQLDQIFGELEGTGINPHGDLQDMYLISIIDPDAFSATTFEGAGGFADFDTQLWLFSATRTGEGIGLLANDNALGFGGTSGSFMGNASDDNSGARVTQAGLYYLAITRFDNDPFSIDGNIFFQRSRTETSGPDGNGGQSPITGWNENASDEPGQYGIRITGAGFGELPSPAGIGVLMVAGMFSRRRRRAA